MLQTRDYCARGGRRLTLAPALMLAFLAGCATAERDSANQTLRTVLLDNAEVLVVETRYPKGGSTPTHTHLWPHVVYVIEGGTVQTTAPDGSVSKLELRPGQTLWRDAQSHSTRNIGSTTVRIVEVAIKNAAVVTPAEVFPVPR